MDCIDLPPYAPTLIESTRAIGYSLETAIADVIDNSIAASASHIDIFFLPTNDPYLAILDNGIGMSDNEINIAMQYGSRNPNETRTDSDLGRFGLGLKTASLSQCRTLTVVSKKDDKIVGRCWDIDHIIDRGTWSLQILNQDEISNIPHVEELQRQGSGTIVLWKNLDRLMVGEQNFEKTFGRKIDFAREHIRLVFHRYLSGEQGIKRIKININHVELTPIDPFLNEKSLQTMDDEILNINGSRVIVRPHLLPHLTKLTKSEIEDLGGKDGLRRQQGFYVYRNKRLIVWGTWFRMMRKSELSKLARIQVDIPNSLDELWTLDIKKSIATPPTEVKNNLNIVIEQLALKSKRTWEYRGEKETNTPISQVWKRDVGRAGEIYYRINRQHPLVEQLLSVELCSSGTKDNILKAIEKSLPLNKLYLDLTNDTKIENDTEMLEEEAKELLLKMLENYSTKQQKNELIDRLLFVDPFDKFPNLFHDFKNTEDNDGKQ